MQRKNAKAREVWNAFVRENAPRSGAFLQSFEWGAFQEALGRPVVRIADEEGGLKAVAQCSILRLPVGRTYLTCPKGPIVSGSVDPMALLEQAGKEAGAMFVRFEPGQAPRGRRVKKSLDVQPSHTLITDLLPPESALLSGMHQKTRYNIRLAEKKGVRIDLGLESFTDEMWQVFEATASRGDFRLHDRAYYETMLAELGGMAFLAVASFEGTILAVNVMIDFGKTRTYLHGASSGAHRSLMGPYVLHWKLMQDAKEKGMAAYDWWGIAPEGAKQHPWEGISRFKLGFGGERVAAPGTYDLILNPLWYSVYTLARKGARHF